MSKSQFDNYLLLFYIFIQHHFIFLVDKSAYLQCLQRIYGMITAILSWYDITTRNTATLYHTTPLKYTYIVKVMLKRSHATL